MDSDEELFVSYLDGELDEEQAAEFERKLAADEEFSLSFGRYRETVELVQRVGPIEAPESLLPSVQRRLARRTAREFTGPQVRFPYELLAFMVLLAAMLYMYFALVPSGPGEIGVKEKPGVVEVDLVKAPPDELVTRFELKDKGRNDRGERLLYGKYGRKQAAQLLEAVAPLADSKPSLPGKGDRFIIWLAFR